MELLKLEKMHEGRFLTYYLASYRNRDNAIKKYEFISRNHDLTAESFGLHAPEGVEIIVTTPDDSHILLNREFRLSANGWIYNFPAGLIDPGENGPVAAERELREETGVKLLAIRDIIENNYSAHGICDEVMSIVIGTGEGEIHNSEFANEEIEAGWFSRAEVKAMLKRGEAFSTRAAMYLYLWADEKVSD